MKSTDKKKELDLRLYILVRTDLDSMNPGKMGAQTSHASNAFVYDHFICNGRGETDEAKRLVGAWMHQTNSGFGTCITLSATINDISKIIEAQPRHALWNTVVDPTYPYDVSNEIFNLIPNETHTAPPIQLKSGGWRCFREEITCLYYFGHEGEGYIFKEPIAHLKLLP